MRFFFTRWLLYNYMARYCFLYEWPNNIMCYEFDVMFKVRCMRRGMMSIIISLSGCTSGNVEWDVLYIEFYIAFRFQLCFSIFVLLFVNMCTFCIFSYIILQGSVKIFYIQNSILKRILLFYSEMYFILLIEISYRN